MARSVEDLERRAIALSADLERTMPSHYRDMLRRDPAGYQNAWLAASASMQGAVESFGHLAVLMRERADTKTRTPAEWEVIPDIGDEFDVPY